MAANMFLGGAIRSNRASNSYLLALGHLLSYLLNAELAHLHTSITVQLLLLLVLNAINIYSLRILIKQEYRFIN